MNKTLKKTLSIILTIVMIVTTIPFVFAADTVTVYLKNAAGWRSTLYAFCWKDNGEVQPLGSWPGTLMDEVEGESQLYAIDVPTDIYAVIFNDGGLNMTPDLFLPTDGANCYNNGTEEWYKLVQGDGIPLTVDVTQDDYVEIGSGQEYYDEDGYILTGSNENADIFPYEGCTVTFDNLTAKNFNPLFYDETINVILKGNNEIKNQFSVHKEDYVISAVDGGTLKVPYMSTDGNDGTVTVNSGNIILDRVTEDNSPTIACAGGFIINGGTVTASNNYFYVVDGPVTLNGGELNIISTSADFEAINDAVTMEKGALLTVSAASGILSDRDSAEIVMADGAEENDCFFVRYDTESEFVPASDIEAALDSKTYAEIKIDSHSHSFADGTCGACGYVCPHENFTGSTCDYCGYVCEHDWSNLDGVCATGCGTTCAHESYTGGVCDSCGYVCPHESYADGECGDCGLTGELVTITMNDSYGDGWNGNAVVILKLVDGEYIELDTVTFDNGSSYIFATTFSAEDIYAFAWYEGNYSDECSFTVAVNGETVFETDDCSNYETDEILYISCAHTYTNSVCTKCGWGCKHENFTNLLCDFCGYVCEHDWSNFDGICATGCGTTCAHESYTGGVCDSCGYVCPHESYADGECGDCGLTGGLVTITMNDGYGDGWNGNAVIIKRLVDGVYKKVATATFDDGYSYIFTTALSAEDIYALVWNKGSYADECSFTLAVDGETVFETDDCSNYENGEILYTICDHTYTNGVCTKCGWACKHDTDSGECSLCGKYIYAITHQPTDAERYVELNDDTDASYQWYSFKKENIELTDESSITSGGSYSAEKGWTVSEPSGGFDAYLTVSLKYGETIRLVFEQYIGHIYIIPEWGWNGSEFIKWVEGTEYIFTAYEDSVYTIKLTEENAVRAYMDTDVYTKLDGETGATLASPVVGNKYACEVTFADGTKEMSEFVKFPYRITHQPTAEEPYVELNDDTDATYQWYKVEGGDVEITDENATVYSGYYGSTSYSEDAGWTGVYPGGEDNNERRFFIIDLKKGDKVRVEFSGALTKEVYLFAGNSNTYSVDVEEGKTVYELTAEGDDNYQLLTWLADEEVTVKAYVIQSAYTPVDGQTSATLIPSVLGEYACKVTFADGSTEMSEVVEITTLHTCDFSGEWTYDSEKHWKECANENCDKISEEADHSYTEGKCECGYTCPHESYTKGYCDVCEYPCFHSFTEFNETVAPKCEETGWEESYCDYDCGIKLEQEIPALEHDWVSGGVERPTQNIDLSWSDGYYYDTCKNDATHINITGVAKRADYTAYNEAYKALKAEQKNEALTDAGAASVNQAVMTGMMMPQDIIEGEGTAAYLNNWVKNAQNILAKIASGEYVKADYTEIDEAIKAIDESLENATISEEMTAELADIKADIEALKENADATMADVNELLDRAETITETMNNCANGVHSFTKYEEETAPECGKAGLAKATCDNGCGATDEKEIPALTHSFTKYEEVTAPECGKAGKEVATCDNGCGETDEKEIPALTHVDNDGDYLCDNGCGTLISSGGDGGAGEPETPDEPSVSPEDCDCLCHADGFFGAIFSFLIKLFARVFQTDKVCDCGVLHY